MIPKKQSGFLEIATQRTVVTRAFRIALVVGSVLALINHGDRLISGQISGSVLLKIGMTFLVPYGVSTFSSVLAVREKLQSVEPKQN